MGWLKVLENKLDAARVHIFKALKSTDDGQRMSFNVCLAGLNIVTRQYFQAEQLLLDSLEYFLASKDYLSENVIYLYLGAICIHTNRESEAINYFKKALGWFSEHNIDYFPHWWHPNIVKDICSFSLSKNIFPSLVERITVARLGKLMIEDLHLLLLNENQAVRNRAYNLLYLLDDKVGSELENIDDDRIKHLLEELLSSNTLRRDAFERLQRKLITAQHRQVPNPVIIAVFGLYLRGEPRQEIAAKIGRTESLVKNYISEIFQIFNIPPNIKSPRKRKTQLKNKAKQEGFI